MVGFVDRDDKIGFGHFPSPADVEPRGQMKEMDLGGSGIHSASGLDRVHAGLHSDLGVLVVARAALVLGLPVVADPFEGVLQ